MLRLYLSLVILVVLFNCSASFSEELFDEEVYLFSNKAIKFDDFSSKYIKDIDIENFIKKELKNDYVVVSLDECIDVALKNNFDIKIQNHNYKSSKYEYQNALSNFMPILGINAYITDYRGQLLVGGVLRDKLHETAISVTFQAVHKLTEGGKQIFEAKAKRYFQKSKKHDYNFTKSQVLYYTVKYYYELLLAKENIEIFLRNLIERNAQLTLSENLYYVGYGTKFDVIRSKNETAQAKVSLIRALNNFRARQARLAEIMGINVETAIMPFETDVNQLNLADCTKDIKLYFIDAYNNREDLRSYRDIISYEKNIKYTYLTEFVPKPYVTAEQRFQGTVDHSVKPNYMLGAYIDWYPGENTFLGTITKVKAQKETIKATKLQLQNKLREIEKLIIEAYFSSIFNNQEAQTAKRRVEYSTESIRLAMGRFYNGQGILLDVINAQSEVTQARVEYISAVINYNISQAELLYATGKITKEILFENYKP